VNPAMMIEELYDALMNPGNEEKARAAARAIAGYEDRFNKIERDLLELKGRVNLVTWMVGFSLAFHLVTLGLLLRLAFTLPD
jgi:hypothetical protein